jgi:hypothetical protein
MARRPRTLPDPKDVFLQAENFALTQNVLVRPEQARFAGYTAVPTIVLSAFASELFLKSLLLIEGSNEGWGHGLFELFDKLSQEAKTDIEENWKAVLERKKDQGPFDPRSLQELLKVGSKTFEVLRYAHEGVDGLQFHLSELPEALRTTIVARKPEWADIKREFKTEGNKSFGRSLGTKGVV